MSQHDSIATGPHQAAGQDEQKASALGALRRQRAIEAAYLREIRTGAR